MRVEMLLSLIALLLAAATVPENHPTARVGEDLRGGESDSRTYWLPDREALLTLGPGSIAVVAEGGHDISLNQGSARIEPRRADMYGIQTADIKRRANARIESTDGGVISLTIRANHDVHVSVTGGTAVATLPGWPGARRALADGASLVLPADAEKIPAD